MWLPLIFWSPTCTYIALSVTGRPPEKLLPEVGTSILSPSFKECDQFRLLSSWACFNATVTVGGTWHFLSFIPSVKLWPSLDTMQFTFLQWWLKVHCFWPWTLGRSIGDWHRLPKKGVLLISVVRSNKMKDFSLEVKIPINFIFQDRGEIKT